MKVSQLFETIRKTAGASEKMTLMKENISDVVKQIFADIRLFITHACIPEITGHIKHDGIII